MEAHYKMRIEEKVKGMVLKEKKTLVLIGYKVLAHTLDGLPEDYLEADELNSLAF